MKNANVGDVIVFKNLSSGTVFKSKIIEVLDDQFFKIEIIACDTPHFIGNIKEIDFSAPETKGRIEFISVESFEDTLARYEAAKFLNCCREAVNTNDETWYNESFAQYTLWKQKIKENEG